MKVPAIPIQIQFAIIILETTTLLGYIISAKTHKLHGDIYIFVFGFSLEHYELEPEITALGLSIPKNTAQNNTIIIHYRYNPEDYTSIINHHPEALHFPEVVAVSSLRFEAMSFARDDDRSQI